MATSPILWLDADMTNRENSNLSARRAIVHREAGPDGEDIIEKHPQFMTNGDEAGTVFTRYPRFVRVVKHDGHTVFASLSCGASSTDQNYANHQRAKHRHFGWFKYGACPIAEVGAGRLRPDKILDKAVRAASIKDPPCQVTPGVLCQHAKDEIAARQARHVAHDAKVARLAMSEDAKRQGEMIDSIKALAASASTANQDTAKMIADALAQAMAQIAPMIAAAAAQQPAKAVEKAPEKK